MKPSRGLLDGPRPLVIGAYYLHEMTARALLAGEDPLPRLDEVYEVARRAGAVAMRALACHVGNTDTAIQSGSREVRMLGLRALELVVKRAAHARIRLVLSLSNAWDDYGGARALTALAGFSEPMESDRRFFVTPAARAVFRFGTQAVLSHPIDGVPLGRHPSIAAWEPMNEMRTKGLDRRGLAMRAWLDGVAREIRTHVGDTPLSSGEEGLDHSLEQRSAWFWRWVRASHLFKRTQSFRLNASSPYVDYPSIHVYPQAWGVRRAWVGAAGERFIKESAAFTGGKPLFVGEMGAHGPSALEHLARWARATWSVGGIAGIWMLASPHMPEHRDHYAIDGSTLIDWARATRR